MSKTYILTEEQLKQLRAAKPVSKGPEEYVLEYTGIQKPYAGRLTCTITTNHAQHSETILVFPDAIMDDRLYNAAKAARNMCWDHLNGELWKEKE